MMSTLEKKLFHDNAIDNLRQVIAILANVFITIFSIRASLLGSYARQSKMLHFLGHALHQR